MLDNLSRQILKAFFKARFCENEEILSFFVKNEEILFNPGQSDQSTSSRIYWRITS
jgi:hypothetical protein